MQQITVAQFLSAIQQNAQRVREYSLGCDGSDGKCDCIGLIIGALRLTGLQWKGTHGSNWAARNAVDDMRRIDSDGSLIPGMVVFKVREPGDDRYSLPAAYRTSPDQRDYYHVGVVTSVNPLRITHCTSTPGGIKVDNSLGAWRYAAKLKQVDYEQEEQPMDVLYEATVYADNGLPVRMRNKPSTNGKVIEQIPCGTVVDVLAEQGEWRRINDQGVDGWMMARFLRPVADGNDTSSLYVMTLEDAKAVYEETCALVEHANKLMEILNKADWGDKG